MAFSGRVLVYGGRGALGSAIVDTFKAKNWWVASIDFKANDAANENVVLDNCPTEVWEEQNQFVLKETARAVGHEKLDAILCVAGGWAGGNAASADFIKNADLMWKQSVWTSSTAAALASHHLKENGVLTLPGAKAALDGTPGMIGYGMAKAAVHQLVKSLAGERSGLPQGAFVAAVLPITLDTPMNRKWMPDADQSTWTPLEYIAELFLNWCQDKNRPPNGSLAQLVTKGGQTEIVIA